MLNFTSLGNHSSTMRQLHVAKSHALSLHEHPERTPNGGIMTQQDWSISDLFITTLMQFTTNGANGTLVQGWTDTTSMQGS